MPARKAVATPVLDQIKAAREDGASEQIGAFLDWLAERGIKLAEYHEGSWTCEDCGAVPKDDVVHVSWMADDTASWRHRGKACSGFKVRHAIAFAEGKSVPSHEYPQGGAVDHVPPGLYPAAKATPRELLAAYFEIDENAAERERRALLDELRRKP